MKYIKWLILILILGILFRVYQENKIREKWQQRLDYRININNLFETAYAIPIIVGESNYDRDLLARLDRNNNWYSYGNILERVKDEELAKLIYAQGIIESQGCVRIPAPYNCWGRTAVGGGWLSFGSFQEALDNQKDYTRRHLDNCHQERKCYFSAYAEDPRYQSKVEKLIN